MAQWVKVLAAKPDDLKCVPGTCIGQNTFLQVVLGLQNSFCGMGRYIPRPKIKLM